MILLSGHSLTPASKIPIESMSLRLRERDSAAVITMAGADLHGIAINSWMRDDNGMVWRVRSIQHKYADSTVEIQLEHVILALKDLILFGEITPATITGNASATTCTALQAITYILAQHPDWTLGTYGYGTVTNAYKFDGDNLYDALERVCNTLDDPWWTLDTSVYPFQISIAPKQSGVACELRPDRNLSAITKTVDMSGCYTRFYPIGKGDLHITGGYVSKNESTYGVIARVETDQSLETEAELIAWANERLGKHAEPEVTVRAQGFDLAEATGEPLDQLTLGRICRVPLPEYNTTILDRITELYYPDMLRAPESVEITMANRTEDITRIIANEIKTGGGRGGSGGRRAARVEGMVEEFDNSDIWVNRDSVWAVCGAYTVYTDSGGTKHLVINDGAALSIERNHTEYGLYYAGNLTAGVIVDRLNNNGTTTAKIKASLITLDGQAVADALEAQAVDVQELHAAEELSIEKNEGFVYNTVTVNWKELYVDNVFKCEFLGNKEDPDTININIADTQIYRTGVSAAGTLSEAWSKAAQTDTYSTVYTVTSGTNQQRSITLTRNSPTWSTAPGVPGGMTYEIYAGGDTRMVIPVLGNVPYQQGLADAQAVTFENPTYSGSTWDVTSRNLVEHISNGSTQSVPMRITRSAEWAGLDTNTPFTSAWLETAAPGTSSYAARMRLVIYADEPYSEGYTKGLAEGYSPADDIRITVPQVYYHQTKPSGYTEISGLTVSTNQRWYAFKTYIKGHSGDTKGFCFYVDV